MPAAHGLSADGETKMKKLSQILLVATLFITTTASASTYKHWHLKHPVQRVTSHVQTECLKCTDCHKQTECQVAKTHYRNRVSAKKMYAKISWYGPGFHGRKTASGERFNQYAMTAAHKTLPFGTKVKITNPKTNKSVIVTINDRGPYIHGRQFDLSKGAAQAIGMAGVANVTAEVLG